MTDAGSSGRLADLLYEARRSRQTLVAIPADARPASLNEGMAIQDEVERRLALPVGGWKVGVLAGDVIYRAPIYGPTIHASPAAYPGTPRTGSPTDATLLVEGEIAFTLGRDLPDRGSPYPESAVIEAIDSACVAIEVVQWRLPQPDEAPLAEKVADHLGNDGLVIGAASRAWPALDRRNLPVRYEVNGAAIVDQKAAKEGLADPIALMVWLANHLAPRGGLKAGQIVTTGSWIGAHAVRSGDDVRVAIEGLGEVRARFT